MENLTHTAYWLFVDTIVHPNLSITTETLSQTLQLVDLLPLQQFTATRDLYKVFSDGRELWNIEYSIFRAIFNLDNLEKPDSDKISQKPEKCTFHGTQYLWPAIESISRSDIIATNQD